MSWLRVGWITAFAVLAGVRLWNGFTGPLLRGYDDHGHVGYVLFLDLYRAIPCADQGWSYFQPPLHYLFGWLLAQAGSAEVLLHGLALLNGLWSFAIAGIAALVVRLACPGRSDLSLVAFASVGLLPVYLYTSTMAGNELTAAFFGTSAFALFVANECREVPRLRNDAIAGALFGLALLSKVNAALFLAAAGLALGLRLLRTGSPLEVLPRIVMRGLVAAGVALVVASPYYARNVSEFGTPFEMSRDNPHVARLEALQPPGDRSWRDFVYVPARLFADPSPRAEHMLHSVWGSAYAQTWSDPRMSWDNLPDEDQPRIRGARSVMVALGLVPTLLVILGAALALLDVVRRERRNVYVPVFCVGAVSLASFVGFAVAAPQYSALEASYLLGLTLPYAVFLARGVEQLAGSGRPRWWAPVAAGLVAVPALCSALVHADGVLLPRLGDHHAVASMRFYFGDFEAARRFYVEQRRATLGQGGTWDDELATVALATGDPFEARSLLELKLPKPGSEPYRWNRLAVATALTGDLDAGRKLVDLALEAGAGEVGLTNRGVLRAALGDLEDAERDLRAALDADESLAPAWWGLADVMDRSDRPDAASWARSQAVLAAAKPPRGHPYGIPDGLGQYPSASLGVRFMLRPADGQLALARAPFGAGDVIAMRDPAEIFASRPHVVLIVVDTLRADHLGAYGYPRPTSPHIDRLAREGVRFSNVFAPSSWTLPSVASIFTSKPPSLHQATSWGRRLSAEGTTFVERLHSAGYRTIGVSGNFVHITEKMRFDQGFDDWRTLSYEIGDAKVEALLEQKGVRLRAPSAAEVNAAVFEALPDPGPRPLFLYVHYMEPHSSYDPPPAKRNAFASTKDPVLGEVVTSELLARLVRGERELTAEERQRLIDLYDAEIATVDEAIGALLAELEARGFGDKLVVALAADHGEEFGEHGSWFHGLNLYRESLSVPFVLWDSREVRSSVVVDAPSDLLDVPTTLLAVAGVGRVPGMLGRDLLAEGPRFERPLVASLGRDKLFEGHLRPRSHKKSAIHWPWKVLVDSSWKPTVYDLEHDPLETRPLALGDPEVPADVRRKAEQLATPPPRKRGRKSGGEAPQKPGPGPAPDDLERLRALGYAD